MKKFLILLLFFCFSCKSKEIEDYTFILGMGFDKEGEDIILSVESSEDFGKSTLLLIKEKSIMQCFDILYKENSNIPYLNHCEIILLGSDFAKEGLNDLIDYILYDPNMRLTNNLCVVKDGLAKDILSFKKEEKDIVSNSINNVFDLNINTVMIVDKVNVKDYINRIKMKGNIVLPIVSINNDNLDITGGACLAYDKLYFYLSGDEINIIKLLRGKLKEGLFEIGNSKFYLNSSRRSVYLTSNEIKVKLDLTIKPIGLKDIKEMKEYKDKIVLSLNQEIEKIIWVLKDYGVDPFFFSIDMYKNYPLLFKKVSGDYYSYFMNALLTSDISVEFITQGIGYKLEE